MTTLFTLEIRYEQDVVQARQRTRELAEQLGFDAQDQARLATAVSEMARNAFQYAQGGTAEFYVGSDPQTFLIQIQDQGQGIPHLADVLDGRYTSSSGMGVGLAGTRRLMDVFEVQSQSGTGTRVVLGKLLPKRTPHLSDSQLQKIRETVLRRLPQNPFEEIQQQNQELLRAMAELRKREEELNQLNQELEDTNRGVVALYAELDEKASSLQQANELKTRFFSNMSHEFRTPLNSILSLSRMLLSRMDGDLNPEQEKQVTFIHKAADGLSELINDLLDLAKVEAGKIEVRPSSFEVRDLFGTLRGMLRPLLLQGSAVALIFEEPGPIPTLYTDEGKVAQILRNFVSNALKFTEQGEVRVTAVSSDRTVTFSVSDTGIGIAPEDQERIFEDFVQIESKLQKRVKGTGLGLPLSRKLTELLGGTVAVQSQLGQGSTFSATIPIVHPQVSDLPTPSLAMWQSGPTQSPEAQPAHAIPATPGQRPKVLLIDDDPAYRYVVKQLLADTSWQILEAENGQVGLELAQREQPTVIVLDLLMPEISGFEVLRQLKKQPQTQAIPVIIHSSTQLDTATQNQLSQQSIAVLPKETTFQPMAISQLRTLLIKAGLVLDAEGERHD